MTPIHRIEIFRGGEVAPWLDAVDKLRIAVFRDWPYLYEGDLEYERDYLATYARSPGSVVALAIDGERVVGAATGLPLADETPAFQRPFLERGMPLEQVFYFGESVLLPQYRGRGIGHAFFDVREARARELGARWTAFCAVDRDADDPRRPANQRSNDGFWERRGYVRQPGMRMRLGWNEIGRGEAENTLTFWLRDWGSGL
ncbi:MAG: GNAT family N-acetyltransferase [Pseudoxanthomonas sp.]